MMLLRAFAAPVAALQALSLDTEAISSVLPVTGDDRPIGMIIGLMAIALIAVLALAVVNAKGSKKKKKK